MRCIVSASRAAIELFFSPSEPPLRLPYRSPTPERLWLREPPRNRKVAALCLRGAAAHRPLRSATSRSPANASPLRAQPDIFPVVEQRIVRLLQRSVLVDAYLRRVASRDNRLHALCDSGIPAPRRNRHTHTLRPVAARRSPTSCQRRRRAACRVRKSVGRSSFGSFIDGIKTALPSQR